MSARGSTPFTRLGRVVYRRRRYVIVAWILALVLVIPIVLGEGKVTSLQQGAATGSELESVKASNIIAAEFQKSVPNSTLLVVVNGGNVSSVATQQLIARLVSSIKGDHGIRGLNSTADVYSRLYAAIRGINNATLTTAHAANGTGSLLLGVPAAYAGVWGQVFQTTHNVTSANMLAYQQTLSLVSAGNVTTPPSAGDYLTKFYSAWVSSWTDPLTASLNLTARTSVVTQQASSKYVLDYFPPQSQPLAFALIHSFGVGDYLYPNSGPNRTALGAFAVSFIANSTSYSTKFVSGAYSLGTGYSNDSLYALAGNIVWNPSGYALDTGLSTLVSSLVSPDRSTTLITLGLNQSSDQNIVALRSVAHETLVAASPSADIQSIQVTGADALSYDFGSATQSDLGLILPVTIILLIVATGLFFRSVLTPFITLGTIGVALGISQVFVVLVGTFIAKVDFTIPTILLTVLIGVGTDYSVFVLARYREERVTGASVQGAVETAVTWAGESIATSGATVIISFLALSLTSITFLKTMGIAVGLGVLVALAVALTLVPAIVSIVGTRTFWPTSGQRFARYSDSVLSKLAAKRGYFSRSGSFAVKRAKVLIILALVVSVPALYVYTTTTPTYDFLSAAPSSLESVSASNHLTAAFGGGKLFPTYVVLTFSQPVVAGGSFNAQEMATVEAISSHLARAPDVRNVSSPSRPFGTPVNYTSVNGSLPSGARTFSAMLQGIGADNRTVLVTINFAVDPYSTQAISDAESIRNYLHSVFDSAPEVTGIYVGGASGSILDTKNVFDSQFNSVVPIVAVGVALVLLAVLGSLFLPVFAVLSVLMSIVWTLAATKLVFQQFFDYQILFLIPFFLFVTLLGLGMDYNIFILTRVREEATKGKHLDDAIVGAIEQTGGIITAAAIILAGSLGALMLSSDLLLKEIGFSFAYSILIDALIVRTYMVPAVMSTMGRWNWYSPIPYLNRSNALFRQASEKSAQA